MRGRSHRPAPRTVRLLAVAYARGVETQETKLKKSAQAQLTHSCEAMTRVDSQSTAPHLRVAIAEERVLGGAEGSQVKLLEVCAYYGDGWRQRTHEIDLVCVQGDRAGFRQSPTAKVNICVKGDTRYCHNVAAEVSRGAQSG